MSIFSKLPALVVATLAGPLVIATRVMVVVLGLVSLDVGVEDILGIVGAAFGEGGGRGGWVVGGILI